MDIDIKQSDLFANKKVKEKATQMTKDQGLLEDAKDKSKEEIPEEYVAVKFNTLGKLLAPAVLHFKNYTLEDAADLADFSEENQYEVFIKILNRCVYEDFDCSNLHRQELLEVLLTIYATYWSPVLERQYLINEDLTSDKLGKKENIGYARIRIATDIILKEIPQEFKTPFSLTSPKGDKFTLRTPVVGDLVFAKKFLELKFLEEEKRFAYTKRLILQDKESEVAPEELVSYKEYLSTKLKEGLLVERSQMLLTKNKEELDDLKKLELARTLPLGFWAFVTQVQKMNDFGIDPKITFYDDNKKKITRSFQFRFIDLFPPMEQESSGGYKLSFD